jgi:hypothetical protein
MKYIKLFEQWLADQSQPFLFEGGAAGHMMHPFDDTELTFADFKQMINSGLMGELNFEEAPTEKTDGQNLFVTVQDGEVKFSRNKTELKFPMTLSEFKQKFQDHPSEMVRDTFQYAAEDLANQLIKLSPADQIKYFNNGKDFMNMELIYSLNPNVINYDTDVIQFHGIKKTDGQGNVIGEDSKPAKEVANILQKVNADIGKTFKIIPPKEIQIQKDLDFSVNRDRFIKKVDDLRNRYGLNDGDEVSRYHEMWWRELIDKEFPNLTQDFKEGLLKRWAYDDKKTLNMRSLDKELSSEEAEKIKKFDKEDVKKKYKENIRPFEDLFLELGSTILKNASNFLAANPTEEAKRLRAQIESEANKIRLGGGIEQIQKVEAELDRLNRIGGIESIYPTEGIVFKYKGKTYKLTGTFAALNQLLGIIKYGR